MVTHHTQLITHALNLFDAERCKHCAVIVSWCSSCRIAFSMLLSYYVLLIATRGLAREQQEPLFEIGYAGFIDYHAMMSSSTSGKLLFAMQQSAEGHALLG